MPEYKSIEGDEFAEELTKLRSGEKIPLGMILANHINRLMRSYMVGGPEWYNGVDILDTVLDPFKDPEFNDTLKEKFTSIQEKSEEIRQDRADTELEDSERKQLEILGVAYKRAQLAELMGLIKRLGMIQRDERGGVE